VLNDPTLTAWIVTNGREYPGWESVEISREFGIPVSYMRFTAAEDENVDQAYAVNLGDLAQGYLAGIQVINGEVIVRQVVFDKATHSVEVVVASQTHGAIVATVANNPGQYKNQTILQMAQTVANRAGITVLLTGDTSGAEIPFLRVSEHIGERCIDFIGRLAMWRNLHLVDNSQGNLVLTRASSSTPSAASLVEGVNIEAARLVMSKQFSPDTVGGTTQQSGNDQTNGTASSQVYASTSIPNYVGPPRPFNFLGEMAASQQEIQLRVNHAAQLVATEMIECVITVPGWLMDSGQLWISLVGDKVATPIGIFSRMLFPLTGGADNFTLPSAPGAQPTAMTLLVKGVKHIQDNHGGTRTEITCCLPNGLGSDLVSGGNNAAALLPGVSLFPVAP
jgi:prophage tail gpP-like protein